MSARFPTKCCRPPGGRIFNFYKHVLKQISAFCRQEVGSTLLIALLGTGSFSVFAQPSDSPTKTELQKRDGVSVIDLPTVLRLSNARNLDIEIAREKLNEAKANRDGATLQFFPWLSPGITYRRHDNLIQSVEGRLINVHKQSYAPGATIGAQVDLGEALYNALASRQQVKAFTHALETQRQETAYLATQEYFDLLYAQALINVAVEAIHISTNYQSQVRHAVEGGVFFKGDELRVDVQVERNQLALRQALEQHRLAGARLAQTLRLDPVLELFGQSEELLPLQLMATNVSLSALVAQSLASRPETFQHDAIVAAARKTEKGTRVGPLIPTIGAQYFMGGLGGDSSAGPSRFGEQEDLFVGMSWKIGAGGIFDSTRQRAAKSRSVIAELNSEKARDEISRQVVEAAIRVNSLADQMQSSGRALQAAEKGLELTRLRREFAIGIVLENVQAEQDLTRARSEHLKLISEYNKAQYTLMRALGKI